RIRAGVDEADPRGDLVPALDHAPKSIVAIPDEDVVLVGGIAEGLAEVATGYVDLEFDPRQACGHARPAEWDPERPGCRVLSRPSAGVVQLDRCAHNIDLFAERLVLAFDDRALGLEWVIERLIGGGLAAVRQRRVIGRAKRPVEIPRSEMRHGDAP